MLKIILERKMANWTRLSVVLFQNIAVAWNIKKLTKKKNIEFRYIIFYNISLLQETSLFLYNFPSGTKWPFEYVK